MKDLFKNKLVLVGVGGVLVILIAVGIIAFQKKNTKQENNQDAAVEEEAITLKPEDIGLELVPNKNNTEITMKISDVSKFKSFEYEMSYDALVDDELVPRGAIGSGEVEEGKGNIERAITIGTCSSGTCKYDKGVKKISFMIRLNLNDGKIAVVNKDIDLSE